MLAATDSVPDRVEVDRWWGPGRVAWPAVVIVGCLAVGWSWLVVDGYSSYGVVMDS